MRPAPNQLLSLLCLFLAAGAPAADWPCWRGRHRDGISRETGLRKSWPKDGPPVRWRAELSGGYSSVVVAGGRLFTQSKRKADELVLCFDASTGKKLWEFAYPCDYEKYPTLDKRIKTGPRATPAVDGDRVYAVGTTGWLHCLDVRTGKPVWKRDLLQLASRDCPDMGYCSSPLIAGDRLFVHPGGSKGNCVAALHKADGRVLWQSLDDIIGCSTPVWIEHDGSPQVVFFTGTGGVGVSPADGKPLWRFPWKTEFDLNVATPIYHDGRLFLSSNYGAGGVLLRLKAGGDPEVIWKSLSMTNHFSTSVLYRGHLYGFSNARFRCVDFATGKVRWDKDGLGKGSLLIADGTLIALGEHGILVLAEASPTAYTERARWKALDAICWTVPVLADGTLYVRNEKRLLALDLARQR